MHRNGRVLERAAARDYYNRFGKKQDSQGFYEDPALDDLVGHSGFEGARHVFEFGCGTGKLATRVLAHRLPPSAAYLGCDSSPVMVGLARHRLGSFGERAQVVLSDGAIRFPLPDGSVDRILCCYVLDLLSSEDIGCFFAEAARAIVAGGRLCITSLTHGVNLPSRVVSRLWLSIFRISPALVGGCRPIDLDSHIDRQAWGLVHERVVTPFGVPSQVLVLESTDERDSSNRPASLWDPVAAGIPANRPNRTERPDR